MGYPVCLRRSIRLLLACCALVAATGPFASRAQETEPAPLEAAPGPVETQEIGARSLPLRTALHHDPTLDAPLDRLVAMYRQENRQSELIEMYRAHTTAFPNDPHGLIVLVRLLIASSDPQALSATRAAVARFPQQAFLHYLAYTLLRKETDADALDELDRAIELSNVPRQQVLWTDLLLSQAVTSDRPELLDKRLRSLAASAPDVAAQLDAAEKMLKYKRFELALDLLQQAAARQPAPELAVRIEMAAATAEVGADRIDAATARLDKLLERLAPDYWARGEIVRRRIGLVRTAAQRQQMIEAAQQRLAKQPADEAAVLDLAQLFILFDQRRDALDVLLAGEKRLPNSARIEKLVLEDFDYLHDERGREKYLADRLLTQSDRTDLIVARVKSLFLTSRRDAALAEVQRLAGLLPADQRQNELLELARFLRRSSLASDAADVLKRVVDETPLRVDLRRELAELYITLNRRSDAKQLFAGGLPPEAEVENLLDLVQFLGQQQFYTEARTLLANKIQRDETNLELRLQMVDFERRLGLRQDAGSWLDKARVLADTPSRYRAWIEAAAAFHEETETLPQFVADERARLDANDQPWTSDDLERHLALIEVAAREPKKTDAAAMIEAYLNNDLAPAARLALRRQLVRVLEKAPDQAARVADQLQELIVEDPQSADESRVRLSALHSRAGRADLVTPLLNDVKIAAVKDTDLLRELVKLYEQYGTPAQVLATYEQLTTVEPTNKSPWEAWLARLAQAGQEERLRETIRRLLVGIPGMELAAETRQLLLEHLYDSYNRSVSRQLADGRSGPLADGVALLDAAGRLARQRSQLIWVLWSRAYALNRLERYDARDEAIHEIERVVAEAVEQRKAAKTPAKDAAGLKNNKPVDDGLAAGPDDAKEPARELRVRFADALTLTMSSARRLLTERPVDLPVPGVGDRRGPIPPLATRWAFDTDGGRPISRILPIAATVVVVDAAGTLYGLDRTTGKLLWQREGGLPAARPVDNDQPSPVSGIQPGVVPIGDGRQRLFFGTSYEVVCLDATSGKLAWRSSLHPAITADVVEPLGRTVVAVALYENQVLAFDPGRDIVGSFDQTSGRLLWVKELRGAESKPGSSVPLDRANTGAAFDGQQLLVYGGRTAMIDVARREVQWTVEPEQVRTFPVKLDPSSAAPSSLATSNNPGVFGMGTGFPSARMMPVRVGNRWLMANVNYGNSGRGLPGPATGGTQYVNYQQLPAGNSPPAGTATATAYVGPVASWSAASAAGQPRFAALWGGRVLLCTAGNLSILRCDLPLASTPLKLEGVLVGCCGKLACVLRDGDLTLVDLNTGLASRFIAHDLRGGREGARLQATLDGSIAYVSGPGGIYGLNLLSRKRIFQTPWPVEALGDEDDPRPRPAADSGPVSYGWRGTTPGGQDTPQCLPLVDCVADGVLYATPSSWRVVALSGAEPHGN